MAKYLISFPSAAMVVPDGEWEAVGRDAHAVVNRAGVFRYIPKPWSEPLLVADLRAALAFDPGAAPSADELERRRLEALEPGITQVELGPNGEVLMPGHLPMRPGEL